MFYSVYKFVDNAKNSIPSFNFMLRFSTLKHNEGDNMNKEFVEPKTLEDYIAFGNKHVIKSERKTWNNFVKNNIDGFYSEGIIKAITKVMYGLSQGLSPKKADATRYNMDLTGFMEGYMAKAVYQFHERGKEFNFYWNGQFMSEEEAANAEGTVNPAIRRFR